MKLGTLKIKPLHLLLVGNKFLLGQRAHRILEKTHIYIDVKLLTLWMLIDQLSIQLLVCISTFGIYIGQMFQCPVPNVSCKCNFFFFFEKVPGCDFLL